MPTHTFGALVRREHHKERSFGFRQFPGFPLCIRLVLLDEGDGTDETVRVRLESVFKGTKIKNTGIDPHTIIEWWSEPGFDSVLRKLLIPHCGNCEDSFTLILNGNGDIVSPKKTPGT